VRGWCVHRTTWEVRSGEPSHPELLDYLAWWFMQEFPGKPAWSTKHLLKLIVLSSVYQQSPLSGVLVQYQKLDPANFLLWRANVRRLDFEAFRDSMLTMAQCAKSKAVWSASQSGERALLESSIDLRVHRSS